MDYTIWVDPVNGSDANDGLTFATAVETLPGAETRVNGLPNNSNYTINLVNTGIHRSTTVSTTPDWSKGDLATFVFQGVDPDGAPAMVDCRPPVGVSSDNYLFGTTSQSTVMGPEFRNIRWDLTNNTANVRYGFVVSTTTITQHYYINCHFLGAEFGTASDPPGTPIPQFANTSTVHLGDFTHCVFENFPTNWGNGGTSRLETAYTKCVVLVDSPTVDCGLKLENAGSSGPGSIVSVTGNTFVFDFRSTPGVAVANVEGIVEAFVGAPASNISYTVRDNVIWANFTEKVGWSSALLNAPGGNSSPSVVEDISNNLFVVRQSGADSAGFAYYEGARSPYVGSIDGGTGLAAGDTAVLGDEATIEAVFVGYDTLAAWSPDGTVSFTIPDLRLSEAYQGLGTGGSTQGALPVAAAPGSGEETEEVAVVYPYDHRTRQTQPECTPFKPIGQDGTFENDIATMATVTTYTANPVYGSYRLALHAWAEGAATSNIEIKVRPWVDHEQTIPGPALNMFEVGSATLVTTATVAATSTKDGGIWVLVPGADAAGPNPGTSTVEVGPLSHGFGITVDVNSNTGGEFDFELVMHRAQ